MKGFRIHIVLLALITGILPFGKLDKAYAYPLAPEEPAPGKSLDWEATEAQFPQNRLFSLRATGLGCIAEEQQAHTSFYELLFPAANGASSPRATCLYPTAVFNSALTQFERQDTQFRWLRTFSKATRPTQAP